ncbi:5-dehydro-2-deoxygluconokinase [Alloiococcus otitis]|uniref:Carbohydrate kinase PfkB domain-containing protein n=1 Tax=Alloiococcus otitis ATCC 51267 TaxID=883081 RepID=K9EB90_9LACT|nr:sugar kinase [Alloiococcus otitis]EKU93898.1 hypothetical protein HMPREF9698_00575 [Alloiococcus otitis ATCC 51267]SUU81706.1 5-dehydro-2-deoxygluconokinase [Alloiococcus otitis]
MAEITLLGEALVLFTAEDLGPLSIVNKFTKSLAGAELNVAIGLSRLNHRPAYISQVGQDPFGDYIIQMLQAMGVASQYISQSKLGPTGIMFKNKVAEGDPKTLYYRSHSAFTHLQKEDIQLNFKDMKIFHVTGIPPAINPQIREISFHLMKEARDQGILVTFDPNIRPAMWESQALMVETLNQLASLADIVLPGIDEAAVLTGSRDGQAIADFYFDQGVQAVVVKNGAEGASLFEQGQPSQFILGYQVDHVVDSVGAGDGFATGVLHGLLTGQSLAQAVQIGNAIGSLQVQNPGDNEGLPSEAELLAYMKEGRQDGYM